MLILRRALRSFSSGLDCFQFQFGSPQKKLTERSWIMNTEEQPGAQRLCASKTIALNVKTPAVEELV